ncbi:hypothetical protein [uncultured Piscinibacter sp.]|uniref:hypothetical protein n=1 Tax=uncultured Piscinibacter sp. TaxID=1131835 RepID=UPI0026276C84|nr:hypothetical protein [uncultured Piscinibacter sp.]
MSDAVHMPMLEDEQDILDAGLPKDFDTGTIFTPIKRLHHARDGLPLCLCNSGRRSLAAAC